MATGTDVVHLFAIFLLLGGPLSFFWVGLEDRVLWKYPLVRKITLACALLIWGVGLFLAIVAQTYGGFLAYLLVSAIGFSAITPLTISIALDFSPSEKITRTCWLLTLAAILGCVLGFALSGISLDHLPWFVPFVILGGMGLMMIGPILTIEDPKHKTQEREIDNVTMLNIKSSSVKNEHGFPVILKKCINFVFLLFGAFLTFVLGSAIYYFIQILINDSMLWSDLAILFLLAIYCSLITYCIFRIRLDNMFLT